MLDNANTARDWPEDFGLENGNYSCRCLCCRELFTGHKHRMQCRKCTTMHEARWNALTPEEQEKELEKVTAMMQQIIDSFEDEP